MALDASTAQQLIKRLDDDRANYLDTLGRAHDLLAQALAAAAPGSIPLRLTAETIHRSNTASANIESVPRDGSFALDDESETEDDESLFVQQVLPKEEYDEEGLRKHIKEHGWSGEGRAILKDILDNVKFLANTALFPPWQMPAGEVLHLPHYSIFDVGNDGAPLQIRNAANLRPCSREMSIWRHIKASQL
jgi:hypothetical protein